MRFLKFAVLAALFAFPVSTVDASILGSFLRKGPIGSGITNTINDTNAEEIVKGVGNVAAAFEIGDMVNLFANFNNITSGDSFYVGTTLTAASGNLAYNLLGNGTLTITGITQTAAQVISGRGDIIFSGSLALRENTSGIPGSFVFTDGIAAANGVWAASGSDIAEFGIGPADPDADYLVAADAPLSFAAVVAGVEIDADFGLSATNAGDLGVVANGLTNPNGPFAGSVNDAFGTSTATRFGGLPSPGDDTFDLSTDTQFTILSQVPEPSSLLAFAGLFGLALRGRRRKA